MIDRRWLLLSGLVVVGLTGCFHDDDDDNDFPGEIDFAQRPDFLVGEISQNTFQVPDNDLLTAGLGLDGLMAAAPGYDDPTDPTLGELRRNTLYNNYRALMDPTSAGGFGRLYGPNVDNPVDPDQGLIPGTEYIAYADAGDGVQTVTHMIQVPDHFDPNNPCIVTGTSSGSRDIYGAIGTSGEWGLKRGCAVAYTNKGTGTGFHLLGPDLGYGMRGQLIDADDPQVSFRADLTDQERQAFLAGFPHRVATQHAHSQLNSEADWGRYTLQAIRFAFYVLNRQFADQQGGEPFEPDNTLVIGSSVSNGGGAALRALEQDTLGLIDGVAVSEPNVQPLPGRDFTIRQGDDAPIGPGEHSKSLLDYTTFIALYQPCANLGQPVDLLPTLAGFLPREVAENRCTSLAEKGLLEADTLEGRIAEAQRRINDYAIPEAQNPAQASVATFVSPEAISVTYANQYGLFGVEDRFCDFSFAATDANGAPTALGDAAASVLFAVSNGIPPTGG
ncbi:MAG: 3-hydroxybutyrate oligomer hydrolase family protein, partial [Candidatus Competibacteraceae bacterium]|nr:3-hydroxybutyrate oligomer hydrolase family protein [Candidatus Competibacteraceae bacterium]